MNSENKNQTNQKSADDFGRVSKDQESFLESEDNAGSENHPAEGDRGDINAISPDEAFMNQSGATESKEGAEEIDSEAVESDQSENVAEVPSDFDRPLTRNLLGDNPPGAELAAFEAGNTGDAGSDLFKYNTDNFIEGFRENLDKTESQLEIDKKLREERGEID